MTIQIFSAVLGERMKYVFSFLFERAKDVEISFCALSDPDIADALRVQYGGNPDTESRLYIPACGLLGETWLDQKWANYFKTQSQYHLIEGDQDKIGFDVASCTFYLISRYEEYLRHKPDEHDRYTHKYSLLYNRQWLSEPIVDEWITQLYEMLFQQFGKRLRMKQGYQVLSTVDVDLPWKDSNRIWPYSWLRLLQPQTVHLDPYDTYDWIKLWHDNLGLTPMFFFLVGGSSQYDPVKKYRDQPYAHIVREIDRWADVGLHPSYLSYRDEKIIAREKQRMETWLGRNIAVSRQHYLRLKLPETYQVLNSTGIRADYTMGYAEQIGFRSGTCHGYWWFDLSSNAATELRVYPLHVMDVTLKQYMKLSPEAALSAVFPIIDACKKYEGFFGLLWHNSSLSEVDGWDEWIQTYRNILSYGVK